VAPSTTAAGAEKFAGPPVSVVVQVAVAEMP
jgi:hypothetical protein